MSKHPRRESPAKAARAQAEARTQAEAAQAQADLAEAKVKVATEQDAAIARALQEDDEARRQADLKKVAEKEAEAVRTGHPTHRPGEDLAERGSQDGPGSPVPARVPPGDEPVRADQDRAVAGDLPVAQPGAARVVVVAVEVADPHRVEREAGLRGELPGRLAPGLAVLAGDQQEPPRPDEVLDRAAGAVLVIDPGVRQRVVGRVVQVDHPLLGGGAPAAAVPSGSSPPAPTINKFYALDLAPGRSMAEYLVRNGQQVFVISWRNPDARHAGWGLDTYVAAVLDALDAVERICGTSRTAVTGACAGGIIASVTAAHLAAIGQQDRLACFSLLVTVLDTANAGTVAALADRQLAAAAKAMSARRGYLDGRALAEAFAWLRPGDLVWNYWVNNYLLGKTPPAFDILSWNADTTRMSARLHADFVDLAMDNKLITPGKLTVLGTPVDLSQVGADSYIVAGIADHITRPARPTRPARRTG